MKVFKAAGIICLGVCTLLAVNAVGQVTAAPPYTVSVFASGTSGFTKPDSIAVLNDHVFVGYGNNVATDGSDGKSSTIVEYDLNGNVITTFSVKGHNDGLRLDPRTQQLWAMQNEDGNPTLVILDPEDGTQRTLTFQSPTAHGGGYDDIAFRGNEVFISASNPANNPNTAQAIVGATLGAGTVSVSPVLLGNATAIDIPTGMPVVLNLQDPDSMAFDPMGDLVLDSQADAELIIVHNPGGKNQEVFHLGLTRAGQPVQIDDTVYATAPHGFILVSDRDAGTGGAGIVYKISKDRFSPGAAYSATPDSVAALNTDTGVLTDVVTGMVSPHGMTFISAENTGGED